MSDIIAVLAELNAHGVRLWLEGENLRYGADQPLGAEQLAVLRGRKAEIIALLKAALIAAPPLKAEARTAGAVSVLSFAQERLWFLDQLGLVGEAYTLCGGLRFEGELDVAALSASVGQVVARHEALRTRFVSQDGVGGQVTEAADGFGLAVTDLSGLGLAAARREVETILAGEAARGFDLSAGGLFRARLLRLSASEHVLVAAMHHIIADGWSLGVLTREVGALYEAFSHGRASPLAPLEAQYADYATWQRDWLRGEALEQRLAYWRERLAGAPAWLDLPTDHPRPSTVSHRGAMLPFALDETLTRGLRELARQEGATLFMVLLAAFQVVLGRWSGQDDVVVGTPTAGRGQRQTEGLIGCFINTLALRTDLSGNPSFRELLGRVRETALEAYAHQDLPFEKIVADLARARDLSRAPLVQVMLALQNTPAADLDLSRVRLSLMAAEQTSSKLDLSLYVQETAQGLEGGFEYASDLFEAATIARLGEQLGRVLAQAAAAPRTRLEDLSLLDPAARQESLSRGAGPRTASEPGVLTAALARTARARGAAVAVSDGHQTLSYAALERRATRLAGRLRALGVGPETVVGVCLERSAGLVASLLGVLKAGGAYLPLDPDLPPERLAFMAADAGCGLVISQAALQGRLEGIQARRLLLDPDQADASQAEAEADDGAVLDWPAPLAGNLAYVLYTSGSTGRPKGVMVPHGALVNFLEAMRVAPGLGETDVMAAVTPLSFDIAGLELWGVLLAGGRIEMVDRATSQDGQALAERLARSGANVLQATPSTWRLLDAAGAASGLKDLRILCGGEALSRDLADRLLGWGGAVWNLYGPTETTIWSAARRLELSPASSAAPIGGPIANTRLYVLDRGLEPVATGVSGELYIAGEGLARGYGGRPGLTAERFVACPFEDGGARMYRTGDLARWRADGSLEFLGRLDHQVKLRGFRIELGEIEAALARHPDVDQAIVLARADLGPDPRLAAYVTPAADTAPSAAVLREHLRQVLPEVMIPAAFVVLPAWPLTANGKIDRRALPAPDRQGDAAAHIAPQTPTEQLLAQVWSQVLDLDQIGAEDNFFELGGHSLLAAQVVARLRDHLAQPVSLQALFQNPTPRQLARHIDQADPEGEVQPLIIAPRDLGIDQAPLSFAQERLWFLEHLNVGAAYVMPMALRLSGPLNVGALEAALADVVARHEIFRTRFEVRDGAAAQIVLPNQPITLSRIDLSGLPETTAAERLEDLLRQESGLGFDLRTPPLYRVSLVRLAENDHVLVVILHHIIADGWSLRVLRGDLVAAYAARCAGEADARAPLPVQYADYTLWQRDTLDVEAIERHLDYWRLRLADAPTALALPTDRPRPPTASFAGGRARFVLSSRTRRGLEALAAAEGATLFMVMLTVFQAVLGRWSGQRDIVVGTAVAGRHDHRLEGLVGFFVNTLPIRSELTAGSTVRTLLRRVRATVLDALAHQDAPLERLVTELSPTRDLSRQPLFQVVFGVEPAENSGASDQEVAAVRIAPMDLPWTTSKFDLEVVVRPTGEGLAGVFEYATDLFDAATAERLAAHLVRALEQAALEPETDIDALDLLEPEERRRLLVEWNASARDHLFVPLHERFARQAALAPDADALVDAAGRLSYGEAEALANQIAHRLIAWGSGPEIMIAALAPRGRWRALFALAILKAGGVFLALDPDLPAERLEAIVDDARPAIIVTIAGLKDVLPVSGARHLFADDGGLDEPVYAPDRPTVAHSGAYEIYTSGSTGVPKGVSLSHAGLSNMVLAQQDAFGLTPDDRVLQFARFGFDAFIWECALAWGAGAALHVADQADLYPGADLMRTLTDRAITVATLPPSALPFLDAASLPDLGLLMVAGEACPPSLAATWAKGRRFINAYGPSETTVCASYAELSPASSAAPIGGPIANTRLYVLDRGLEPVATGVSGELYIAGEGLARGYGGRPGLTAERFVACPFEDGGARMYRTGDLARWRADGSLEFLGRLDHQVKLRGFRIELGEIEAALARHPDVDQAIVLARADLGPDPRLVAYVTPAADTTFTPPREDLIDHWDAVFYAADTATFSPNFDGWNSSYDGEPIPRADMQAWLDETVARIAASGPRRLLDLGCGSGLLLQRLAAGCEDYLGIDVSQTAIDRLGDWVAASPDLAHVRLRRGRADALEDLPDSAFDTVVLNSVIQYFPDPLYLETVLEAAARVTRDGGRIHLGDVRSLTLAPMLKAGVEWSRAEPGATLSKLDKRLDRAIQVEEELLVDPGFFHRLVERSPRLRSARIRLKGHGYDNELSRYRYDVVLEIGSQADQASPPASDPVVELGAAQGTAALAAELTKAPPQVWVRGLTRPRLAREGAMLDLIRGGEGDLTLVQAWAMAEPAQADEPDIEDFEKLAAEAGYEVWATFGTSAGDQADLLIHDPRRTPVARLEALLSAGRDQAGALTNDPAAQQRASQLEARLRQHLKSVLPDYACPSAYVVLSALPLNANGKIDRDALPAPLTAAPSRRSAAPITPSEILLAEIWCEVLGLDHVGLDDNFFEIGGHSLIATRVISMLHERSAAEVSLRMLFETPTIRGLAAGLDAARQEAIAPPSLIAAPRPDRLPLSYVQERLWFLDRLGLTGAAYNSPGALRLEGQLDVAAMEASLVELVRRHESLRTRFATVDGAGEQVIDPPTTFRMAFHDLTSTGAAAHRKQAADQLMRAEINTPFDLLAGPVFRATLIRLEPDDHLLVVVMHHIVSDGWSLGVLTRELATLYNDLAAGRPSSLAPLELQYADFALWQRRWLTGPALETRLDYWRGRLAHAPPALNLPTDRPRPAIASYRGGLCKFDLSPALTQALSTLAHREGATLFMVLLAGFKALLAYWSGEDDVVVGSPIAGRTHRKTEALIGFFVNTLALRTDLTGDPSFRALLARVRETALGAYAHQDVPFEKLVAELLTERDLSRQPLFQAMFVLQNFPDLTLTLDGLKLRAEATDQVTSKFDLTLYAYERDGGIEGAFEYAVDLFDENTIARLAEHYAHLLEQVAADPDQRLSGLRAMRGQARAATVALGAPAITARPPLRVHELVAQAAAATPEATALIEGESALSFDALDRRANQVANHLRAMGVATDRAVGVCLDRGAASTMILLGVLKAGGVYLPLDPDYPDERLDFMIAEGRAEVLVTTSRLLQRFPRFRGRALLLDMDQDEVAARPMTPPALAGSSDSGAYMIFTSGSTGRPKGVIGTHRACVNRLLATPTITPLSGDERFVQKTSPGFVDAFFETLTPLAFGRPLVIVPPATARDPTALKRAIERHGVTNLVTVPSLAAAMEPRAGEMPSLRHWTLSGEALRPELAKRLADTLPACQLVNLYGSTEAAADATVHRLGQERGAATPIGRPIANMSVYVLDRGLEPAPVGATGELYVAGDGLARGYAGRPGLTAERFVACPHGPPGRRMYRTGDRVRWNGEGLLEFCGRVDHQIKLRGFRIELSEIEAVLRDHPAVEAAVVVLRGEADQGRLVAYLTGSPARRPEPPILREHVVGSLPDYMAPAAYVWLDALPLTATGKLDRLALPPPEETRPTAAHQPPATAEEIQLAAIWSETLQRDAIGVTDNFFELGGHSLLAVQMIARAAPIFGGELPLRSIFEAPTIADLLAWARAHGALDANKTDLLATLAQQVASLSDDEVMEKLRELQGGDA